ncbi:MAG: hypothetical protein FVQ80_02825 [Planctomycetes bacterium]|nr:hypothetical protein [Planctomycetota bacterium]
MELIKKIKEAEAKAEQIIEQAKADTIKQAQQDAQSRSQALEDAELSRKRAIAEAVTAANAQGLAEIEGIKAQAAQARQQLRDSVSDKTNSAVAKVVQNLKG